MGRRAYNACSWPTVQIQLLFYPHLDGARLVRRACEAIPWPFITCELHAATRLSFMLEPAAGLALQGQCLQKSSLASGPAQSTGAVSCSCTIGAQRGHDESGCNHPAAATCVATAGSLPGPKGASAGRRSECKAQQRRPCVNTPWLHG